MKWYEGMKKERVNHKTTKACCKHTAMTTTTRNLWGRRTSGTRSKKEVVFGECMKLEIETYAVWYGLSVATRATSNSTKDLDKRNRALSFARVRVRVRVRG